MEYRNLGKTKLKVSRMCFGSLTIGPLQRNLPLADGSKLIRKALEAGVNFIDTAQLYRNYGYIREALKGWSNEVVIATKSYAYTEEMMENALEEARKELDLDQIPIFMLHEQESEHTIRGHWPALEYLLNAKVKGKVKAVGISTHYVQGVLGALKYPEIEVISPLINLSGIGIQGGSRDQMLDAIKQAAALGKGIFAMKPLGGGHLIASQQAAFEFLLNQQEIDSIAVGMKNEQELHRNLAYFNGEPVEKLVLDEVERRLHIDDWCVLCEKCVQACPSKALTNVDNVITVDREKCVFCGYCGAACPEFAIKVI
ncbi:MAG: aldo/keto reductase [Candidatus Wallacebacter cryptica]|nr:4Fe-4S binding protein [Bacillota bacterium]